MSPAGPGHGTSGSGGGGVWASSLALSLLGLVGRLGRFVLSGGRELVGMVELRRVREDSILVSLGSGPRGASSVSSSSSSKGAAKDCLLDRERSPTKDCLLEADLPSDGCDCSGRGLLLVCFARVRRAFMRGQLSCSFICCRACGWEFEQRCVYSCVCM